MSAVSQWLLYQLIAAVIGFLIDIFIGEPRHIPHPIVLIGKLIASLEKLFRSIFKKTKAGEIAAGGFIWFFVCLISAGIPFLILFFCYRLTLWLGVAIESVMCWLILATRSLRMESMRVCRHLKRGDVKAARRAVSMIVGRDTEELDEAGITRAAVETVAENTSDGSVAPLVYIMLGGATLGFLYKAVNTMDSMLGYTEEPYKNVGLIPAKADDVFNFIPARISALLMLLAGFILNLNVRNGWRIFKRDRYKHASPNSAQTESVCAGLLGLRLGGDASYHGVLHKKQFIGDAIRKIEPDDIKLACRLLYETAFLALEFFALMRLAAFVITVIG